LKTHWRLLDKVEIPVSAWRVHATGWDLCQERGDDEGGDEHRARAKALIMRIADSFEYNEPLRESLLMAPRFGASWTLPRQLLVQPYEDGEFRPLRHGAGERGDNRLLKHGPVGFVLDDDIDVRERVDEIIETPVLRARLAEAEKQVRTSPLEFKPQSRIGARMSGEPALRVSRERNRGILPAPACAD